MFKNVEFVCAKAKIIDDVFNDNYFISDEPTFVFVSCIFFVCSFYCCESLGL
jgi:hypothetical protein